jgi:amino-acid N-acetyltransferase
MTATIERARPGDLRGVMQLLEQARLPLAGARELGDAMVVARDNEHVIGAAGLEFYAEGALLRSVVVAHTVQRQGIGQRLTEAALAIARERGVSTVFLLTTTAEDFFPRFGFERIARDEVPLSVRASVEFTSACPESAIVMRRLGDATR